MLKTWIRSSLLVASFALMQQAALAADVSVREVYAAAEAGRLDEAQRMMQQVLRDHPNSAQAHFVEAELLSQQGKQAAARAELATAEQLKPGLPFAKPAAVESLKQRLAGQASAARSRSSLPWGLLIAGALVIAFILFAVRSLLRQRSVQTAALPYNGAPGSGYGPGYGGYGPAPGPGYGGGGMGSGIMGGLATGAALGAGMVAGEALAHRLVDDPHAERIVPPAPETQGQSNDEWNNNDMGGTDFGLTDSSWDDGGGSGGDFGGDDWS